MPDWKDDALNLVLQTATSAAVNMFAEGPEILKSESVSICGVDPQTLEELIPERTFQWWPDSLQDSIQGGWQQKQIPGGSHALQQWSSNGGRTISFNVILSRDLLHKDDKEVNFGVGLTPLPAINLPAASLASTPFINDTNPRNKPYNVDVAAAIAYLRAYMYPRYEAEGSVSPVKAPVVAILNFPNMQLNEDGRDTIWTVMQTCDVQYMRSFPNGRPQLAQVSMSFAQVVQSAQGVSFKGFSDLMSRGSSGSSRVGNPARDYANPRPLTTPIGKNGKSLP